MAEQGIIAVNFWDGARNPLQPSNDLFVTLRDTPPPGVRGTFFTRATILRIGLDLASSTSGEFSVIASTKGCSDAGFAPVPVNPGPDSPVHLMLAPRKPGFDFSTATWDAIAAKSPDLRTFLISGGSEDAASQAYGKLCKGPTQPLIACLLNITAAIRSFSAKAGTNFLQNFRRISLVVHDPNDQNNLEGLQQDRFYAWVDRSVLDFCKTQVTDPKPADPVVTIADTILHGATADFSVKEIRFGEANLQFTFHSKLPDPTGQGLVKVEMDIDEFRDELAHGVLEVIPNAIGKKIGLKGLTDPAAVYVLRWMAGKNLSEPLLFDPLYTLQDQSIQLGP